MAKIKMAIPGAVVTADTVSALRDVLRPFTLRGAYAWLEAEEENLPENSTYSVEGIRAQKASAREEIASGGSIELAEFTVTTPNGFEHTWENDEGAPLDYLANALSSKVVLANVAADLRVDVESDRFQARIVVDTAYSAMMGWDGETPGYEVTRIADAVREVISETVDPSRVAAQLQPFKVFVGHGGDRKWEAVREYVQGAGYEVEAFETHPRAGEMTLAIVERMISEASVAVIVMTGVDALEDGRKMARQNVVHELGFAQGRLGVDNTIVLLEDGTQEFTNIAGLTQIRFNNGEIHTTKEHVLATLANKERERAR